MIHPVFKSEQADGVDVTRDATGSLGDGNQGLLREDILRNSADGLQVMVHIADTFLLTHAFEVVAVQDTVK
jgi:hypothetical protein